MFIFNKKELYDHKSYTYGATFSMLGSTYTWIKFRMLLTLDKVYPLIFLPEQYKYIKTVSCTLYLHLKYAQQAHNLGKNRK